MDFNLPANDDPRRGAVRSWLEQHPQPSSVQLAEAGFVAPAWPSPWGLGADPEHQLIINQELETAGLDAQSHNPIGIGWAGPTILAAGTEAQKNRFLWPLLKGEEFWCQLFSEPAAGSDLAGLTTRAELDGDTYLVNGQKVWNTWAGKADFGILLARTGGAKHRGISFFLCPMRQAGIEVRPITEMTGRSHFTEVFFNDARIPVENRLGEENQGWALAKLTLGNERVSLSSGGVLWGMGPTTGEVLESLDRPLDPVARDRAAALFIESEMIRLIGLRIISQQMAGKAPNSIELGPMVAVKKMLADRHGQQVMELATDLAGAGGMINGSDRAWGYLFARALTIGGGTAEVLRNIVAESVLGLPKEAS